ncbi:MAG TPA: response regulator transcription factor [Candidatus Coprosoma intestinipullorum]|uniref:Response regulator transcription factor n=1 Tax=Candidatus Coprosoma intestinipullorum TaxID=2840752 RepID=A0A9D1CXY4_9FIRM|nr:response regulator transcription factor [Candidatus Coprosoma intestinipullorum]
MERILIVEDEVKIREELKTFLENNGYEILTINNFENTLDQIKKLDIDLILMDINIPGINGMHLCREIRKTSKIPIIIVTSRDTEMDELLCMNYGADDFITKPYNMQILLAHIEAVLKRSKPEISHILEYKGMKINLSKGTIDYNNQTIILTKNEIQIFSYLLERQGTVVTRDELMNYLWDTETFIDDNTLTVNMARLRKKLEDLGFKDVIETRRGWGYIIL